MNFQQLRSVREAVRCGFNLTEVATVLHTSQPGISRQIRDLEAEVGSPIFVRSGKRLTGLTEPGRAMLPLIERLLQDAQNLRRVGEEFAHEQRGTLSIAATHSQARYALPHAVRDFRAQFPEVSLHLHQGSPRQVASLLLAGEADIGIATEALASYPQLVTLPCYRWTHSVVVPHGHPLLRHERLELSHLAEHPIVTYDQGYTGRSHIDDAFAAAGLRPQVVNAAMDADVIKTYVELGLGIGIVASIAIDAERDRGLVGIDARHLFPLNLTRLALRRGSVLRGFGFAFIETFAPSLSRDAVVRAFLDSAHEDA